MIFADALAFPFGEVEPTPSPGDVIPNSHFAEKGFCYNIRTDTWTEVQLPTFSGSTVQISSAVEFPISGTVAYSQWNPEPVGLLVQNNGHVDGEGTNTFGVIDTDRNSVVTVTTNFQAPAIGERVTWDSIHIFWERNEIFTDIDVPTTVTVLFDYDWGQTSSQTLTPEALDTTYFSKVMVPREARQSTRLRVTITHEANELFGIEGIAMIYNGEGSGQTTK